MSAESPVRHASASPVTMMPPSPANTHHITQTQQDKLFNHNTDPIPMRRTTEPESISDASTIHLQQQRHHLQQQRHHLQQ
ncbi:hypothetical protein EDD22DRAFT_957453 [Suillus occidentalis]|nr:hypothetical protein EDD22DRAFT_957453 [Suillus occidentalis]